MSQKPSIYDIAQLAGISAGSVSKILNGKGSFSQKTRERVLAIAREQGYVPNFAAKSLREASTHSVGIITPDVSNEFFSSIVLAAEVALRERGYTSYICNVGNEEAVEIECLTSLTQRQVDGFLFVGGSRPVRRELVGSETPLVCVDRLGCDDASCVEVQNDAETMTYDATCALLAHGCRHIVYLSVFHRVASKRSPRYVGYARALAEAGLTPDDRLLLDGPHFKKSYVEAEELVEGLLDAGIAFDGIVAIGDRIAVGAVNALRRHGVAVGSEVRVIGMDDTLYTRIMSPTISTVNRHTNVLAADAALALVAMLDGEAPATRRIVVPHDVVERETTLGV